MNRNIAFIFPGQGSQYVRMISSLNIFNKINKKIFTLSNNILKYNIKSLIQNGPIEKLNQTCYTQPAIFIQSVIYDIYLKSIDIIPSAVAGHSLGEYSALVSAEVLSFQDALNIVKKRAESMEHAGFNMPGMMAAVIGATEEQIKTMCNQDGIVVPANYNSKTQTVISGEIAAVKCAILAGKELGIRKIIPLNVSAAFHSPLMKSARKSLQNVIKSTKFNDGKIPIYQNVDPIQTIDGETIKLNLIRQLENPVLWYQTIKNMNNDNYNDFIEVGPSKVLYNLNKKILPDASVDYTENILKGNYDIQS